MIYLLAGNKQEATFWMRNSSLGQSVFVIDHPRNLYGRSWLPGDRYVEFGTWDQRPYHEVITVRNIIDLMKTAA